MHATMFAVVRSTSYDTQRDIKYRYSIDRVIWNAYTCFTTDEVDEIFVCEYFDEI